MNPIRNGFRTACRGKALASAATAAVLLGLGGCAHTAAPEPPSAAAPGVTVYGTADVGASRSPR